jgi:two-component system chemotaxis response regulator CheB
VKLEGTKDVNYVCPSIDVAMSSLVERPGDRIAGVLLTGMGRDGASGLGHIKKIKGTTMAQSQQTCTVYGMPRKAIEEGYADEVLGPDEIRERLVALFIR